jgi:hypothetical protein
MGTAHYVDEALSSGADGLLAEMAADAIAGLERRLEAEARMDEVDRARAAEGVEE